MSARKAPKRKSTSATSTPKTAPAPSRSSRQQHSSTPVKSAQSAAASSRSSTSSRRGNARLSLPSSSPSRPRSSESAGDDAGSGPDDDRVVDAPPPATPSSTKSGGRRSTQPPHSPNPAPSSTPSRTPRSAAASTPKKRSARKAAEDGDATPAVIADVEDAPVRPSSARGSAVTPKKRLASPARSPHPSPPSSSPAPSSKRGRGAAARVPCSVLPDVGLFCGDVYNAAVELMEEEVAEMGKEGEELQGRVVAALQERIDGCEALLREFAWTVEPAVEQRAKQLIRLPQFTQAQADKAEAELHAVKQNVVNVSVAALERELSGFERVHGLFEYSVSDTDAFLKKLAGVVTSYSAYEADWRQLEAKVNQSNWIQPGKPKSTGVDVRYDPKAVTMATMEGMQAHK